MTTWLAVSVTEEEGERLRLGSPRRDFLELALATGGVVRYAPAGSRRGGWRSKLAGPHLRQAWALARDVRSGDSVFADGEHNGLPLLVFMALRRRRPAQVVMLGHLVSRPWKKALFAVATRLSPRGTLALHSVEQRAAIGRWLGGNWRVELLPYQVDTNYWHDEAPSDSTPRVVVAVGSENRDYDTLCRAAEGLDATVRIAAGSHWARSIAAAAALPPNVEHLSHTLPFDELRQLYREASLVVVPLRDVLNQSGITTILEGMSMEKPVIVTATRGQRESVYGPLFRTDGSIAAEPTADRGPQLLGGLPPGGYTGYFVPPGDSDALRAAITHILDHPEESAVVARNARASAIADFGIDRYVQRLSSLLRSTEESASPAHAVART